MPRTRPGNARGSCCLIETMEARQLLAGNVTAGIVGGVLVVVGDNKANELVIASHPNSTTTVTPAAGTTVNGGAGAATFAALPPISVDLGNGDDIVTLVDLNFQNVTVATGNGNDRVLGDTAGNPPNIFNRLHIDTGNGNDLVHLGGATGVATDLTIHTGNGDDRVELVDAVGVGGNINVDTGNGDDAVRLEGVIVVGGNLTVNGGRGFDVLDRSGASIGVGGTVTFIDIESVVV